MGVGVRDNKGLTIDSLPKRPLQQIIDLQDLTGLQRRVRYRSNFMYWQFPLWTIRNAQKTLLCIQKEGVEARKINALCKAVMVMYVLHQIHPWGPSVPIYGKNILREVFSGTIESGEQTAGEWS